MKQKGITYLEALLMAAMLSLAFLLERLFGLIGSIRQFTVVDAVAMLLVAVGGLAVAVTYRQAPNHRGRQSMH